MWLHDIKTNIQKENAENFAQAIHLLQELFFQDLDYQHCLRKISPFIQRKWALPEYKFVAKLDELPYYFYKKSGSMKN